MKALLLCLFLAVVNAHICMWEPMQRGPFAINFPGPDPCYRKVGPCGMNYTSGMPFTVLRAGQQFTIMLQQALNHYYTNQPGYIEVSFAVGSSPAESDFFSISNQITDYNAMNEVTQTNFSIPVVIPSQPCNACVIRVRYVSNNPKENDRGEIFYQCADVQIVASDDEAPGVPEPVKPTEPKKPFLPFGAPVENVEAPSPCCAPPQFKLTSYEARSWRDATISQYWYDSINQMMRVDTYSGHGATIYDGNFHMFCNFTSGIEWYYNTKTGQCDAFGLDFWNNWCFGGADQSETYLQSITIGDSLVDIWQNGNFYFGSSRNTCAPVFFNRMDTGSLTMYYNLTVGAPDPSLFVPPAACHFREDASKLPAAPKEHQDLIRNLLKAKF